MKKLLNLISVSGGKDSTATLLTAIETKQENISAIFADTGNEHPAVYEYLTYLEVKLGLEIIRLKQDFTQQWDKKANYIETKWSEKGVPDEIIEKALQVFKNGPTGIPFLDLSIIKSRFPSRRAQFCTQYLKSEPLEKYAIAQLDKFEAVTSWQGIRADESLSRSKLKQFEEGKRISVYRQILYWDVKQVFECHRRNNIEPNPLYLQGMKRVGCMPCINAGKNEIYEISKRFPEHFERIYQWELLVGEASKRGCATFFASPGENNDVYERGNIKQIVAWSKTSHGGKQYDIFKQEFVEPEMCSSSYGLCE